MMMKYVFKNAAQRLLTALLSVWLLAGLLPAQADDSVEQHFQSWETVTLRAPLTPDHKLQFYAEAQPRVGKDFSSLILRPAIGYQVTRHFSLWQGYAWLPQFQPTDTTENRIFQQALIEGRLKKLRLSSRTRLEERWIENASGTAVRARSQLRATYPIPHADRWSLVAYDEFYVNLNSVDNGPHNGVDQNRVFAGITRKLGRHANAELGYLNQYVNRHHPPDRMNHVLLFSVNFNLL